MLNERPEPDVRWGGHLDRIKGQHPTLLGFALNWWLYNAPMLERVRQTVPPPARVLEVGTGTGAISEYLPQTDTAWWASISTRRSCMEARRFAEYFPNWVSVRGGSWV